MVQGQGRRRARALRRSRAGGSATRATPSTPISCSRRCARRASCAKHLRFQVSLASVNSALPPRIFPDQDDIAKIRPGFTDALAPRSTPSSSTSQQRSRHPVGLLDRSAGRLWRRGGLFRRRRHRAQRRAVSHALAAHPRERRARLPLLLRHARRLAALCTGRPVGDRRARQRHHRSLRPPRRLDPHSGAADVPNPSSRR